MSECAGPAVALDYLNEMYAEFYFSNVGPFKMLRLDRYFWEVDNFVNIYLGPFKGGEEFDNRRKGFAV